MFISAINNNQKLVRLAQLVEQWTGIPFVLISSYQPNERKTLNSTILTKQSKFILIGNATNTMDI